MESIEFNSNCIFRSTWKIQNMQIEKIQSKFLTKAIELAKDKSIQTNQSSLRRFHVVFSPIFVGKDFNSSGKSQIFSKTFCDDFRQIS